MLTECAPRQTEMAAAIYNLTHTHTQTKNKSQSFSPDAQMKTKHPRGDHIIRVLCTYDSFITGV